jgi:cytochrome P450
MDMAEFAADALAAFRRARDAGGMVDLDPFGIAATRHDQVRGLLADSRLRVSFPDFLHAFGVTSGTFYEWMTISPLNQDGAEHLRWRALMSRTFTPRMVERLRPFLQREAHALIDTFSARGTCEFMAEFADPFPSLGLCELIGVPIADRDRFRGWANTIGMGFSPMVGEHITAVDAAVEQLLAYTGELAAARRAHPRDDLVTRIAQAADEDGGWTDFQVRGFIGGLVFAGHETTKTQLSWMIAALADRPDLWDAVAAGSATAADLVEEILRFRSAAAAVGRRVATPTTVDDVHLDAGQPMLLSLWSANHDDKVYPHPERIDPAQAAAAPHVAFGHGPHHCLGAALARAELQEALVALAARLDCPSVEEGAVWKPPVGINGPEVLPIRFTARDRRAAGGAG